MPRSLHALASTLKRQVGRMVATARFADFTVVWYSNYRKRQHLDACCTFFGATPSEYTRIFYFVMDVCN
jgi:hypothetical protein